MAGWVWSAGSGCRVLGLTSITFVLLNHRFYWGLTHRKLFGVLAQTQSRSHTSNTTPSLPRTVERECVLAAQNHTKHNDEVFACCENVYSWKWDGESRERVQHGEALIRTLQKHSKLPKWCISPNHNLQPLNKCNSCPPPKCLMAVSFPLAGRVCNVAQVVAFDSVNKGVQILECRFTVL